MNNLFKNSRAILTISFSVSLLIIFAIFGYAYSASNVEAAGGKPAHSHEGWPLLNGGETGSYVLHFEEEMNFFQNFLNGFIDTGIYGSWYPLGADNYYERNTEEGDAARDFQNWASIQVDGATGNQTWTYMEFWVMNAPGITVDAGRHPAGVKLRYPTYGTCRAITNNNSADMAAPLKTRAEWDTFRLNAPNITNAAGDCSITGGTGGSGGGGDTGGGTSCPNICDDSVLACNNSCSSCTGNPAPDNSCASLPCVC